MTSASGSRETRAHGAEIKFVVAPDVADQIRTRAREWLAPDPFGDGPSGDRYATTTLYYDTDAQDVFQRRGSYGRAKYRVRRYGANDHVFLERKLRTRDWLNKRRSLVPVSDLTLLAAPSAEADGGADGHADWAGRWFLSRLVARRLHVVCQVAYRRTARVGQTEQGPIRLTLDEAIVATSASAVHFQSPDHGVAVTGDVILEMKFRGGMPVVFKRLAEEFRLEPAQVSKYRLAVAALRAQPQADPVTALPAVVQHA